MNEYDTLPKNYWGGLGTHECNCDPSFSIEDKAKLQLSVYPNPTTGGQITIATGEEIVAILLYDVLGKAIMVESIHDGQVAYIPNLRVPAGMYIVEAETRSGDRLSKRLVVR